MSNKKVEAQIQAIKNGLFTIFEELEEIDKTWNNMPAEARASIEGESTLTFETLEKLPWTLFKEGHRSAWIFADQKGAETLVRAIQARGQAEIGGYIYKLSEGNNKTFVTRNPK